jgi:hypothetical protein
MTADHSSEPEGRQLTVAELLKQYGGEERGSRRRRRAEERDDDSPVPIDPGPATTPGRADAPGTDRPSVDRHGAPRLSDDRFNADGLGDNRVGGNRVSGNGFGDNRFGADRFGGDPLGGGQSFSPDRGSNNDAGHDSFGLDAGRGSFTGNGRYQPGSGDQRYDGPGGGPPGPDAPSAFDPSSGTGWSGDEPGTGGFATPPYPAESYGGPPTGRGPEQSTDFIPRFGETGGATRETDPTRRTGPITSPLSGPVSSSGPDTAISSRAEMFGHDNDLFDLGAPDEESDENDEYDEETARASYAGRALGATGDMPAVTDADDDEDEGQAKPSARHTARHTAKTGDSEEEHPEDIAGDEGADELPAAEPKRRLFRRRQGSVPGVPTPDVPAGLAAEDMADVAALREPGGRSGSRSAVASDDLERAERPSGIRAWLSLIGQWVLGAVGGAALWIGFRFLWLQMPVVALVAAVAATAGLVLLVRAIRRSDDLQTTMLAVLVGLVVTISPAVLLLAVR